MASTPPTPPHVAPAPPAAVAAADPTLSVNLFAGHPVRFPDAMARGLWRARVLAAHDGDTLLAHVDRGFNDSSVLAVRLAGVNSPELGSRDPAARERARAARDRTRALAVGGWALLRTYALPNGAARTSFERYLAQVLVCRPDGSTLNVAEVLLAEGLAVPLDLPL